MGAVAVKPGDHVDWYNEIQFGHILGCEESVPS